jgi:hypothetical protein
LIHDSQKITNLSSYFITRESTGFDITSSKVGRSVRPTFELFLPDKFSKILRSELFKGNLKIKGDAMRRL